MRVKFAFNLRLLEKCPAATKAAGQVVGRNAPFGHHGDTTEVWDGNEPNLGSSKNFNAGRVDAVTKANTDEMIGRHCRRPRIVDAISQGVHSGISMPARWTANVREFRKVSLMNALLVA